MNANVTNKRQEQKEKTRQKLIEVSLHLFTHKGYEGTTIRDIAKEADVSVGLLFHYFSTKQAILEEHVKIAESGINTVVSLLSTSHSPIRTFTEIAKITLGSFEEQLPKNLYLLVNQVLSFDLIPAIARNTLGASRVIGTSIPLIILGQHNGEIKAGDPLALAVAFWGAIQGIAEVLVWNPDTPIPDYEFVVDILRARGRKLS